MSFVVPIVLGVQHISAGSPGALPRGGIRLPISPDPHLSRARARCVPPAGHVGRRAGLSFKAADAGEYTGGDAVAICKGGPHPASSACLIRPGELKVSRHIVSAWRAVAALLHMRHFTTCSFRGEPSARCVCGRSGVELSARAGAPCEAGTPRAGCRARRRLVRAGEHGAAGHLHFCGHLCSPGELYGCASAARKHAGKGSSFRSDSSFRPNAHGPRLPGRRRLPALESGAREAARSEWPVEAPGQKAPGRRDRRRWICGLAHGACASTRRSLRPARHRQPRERPRRGRA